MNHVELNRALRSLERELPAMQLADQGAFRPRFEAYVNELSSRADDPDDAVYVIERADTMLGDLGYD